MIMYQQEAKCAIFHNCFNKNVQHDIVLQVACEKMVTGPDLLANLRNTAGK